MSYPTARLTALCLVLALYAGPAFASEGGGGGEAGGGKEDTARPRIIDHVLLKSQPGGSGRVDRIVVVGTPERQILIEARLVEQVSVDKLDLSSIPLLGNLFGPEFRAADMTAETEIGKVYHTGDGGLFVALQQRARSMIDRPRVLVFNDKHSYELITRPTVVDQKIVLTLIGELSPLPSVRSILTPPTADSGTPLVLETLPDEATAARDRIPFFSDIPALRRLFAGTAHRSRNDALLILIRPSVITGDR